MYLDQWFLTGGASRNFKGGAKPYALYNMESLMNKYANEYIWFWSLFEVMGRETKDNYSREAWWKKG